ncbi:MAG: hypothetical protein ACUZ8O_04635 [Candidatus Anammoxibacter sp.]
MPVFEGNVFSEVFINVLKEALESYGVMTTARVIMPELAIARCGRV